MAALKNPTLCSRICHHPGDLRHNHGTQTTEGSPLPPHTTSQQAELIALTRALTLANNLRVNIHTDSKYAYNILHSNILIWRERGFLTQKGSPIINSDLIHKLLEAALLPNKAAILHCRGHQNGSLISAYNNAADQKAKEIALSHPSLQFPVILALTPPDPPTTRKILSYLHSLFHPSSKTLQQFLRNHFPISDADQQYLDNRTRPCQTCQCTNPSSNFKLTSFPTHQM